MNIELLSPAGSYDALTASINAGADAVYLGGQWFGARAFANNFSNEELLRAIDYVHLHDKRLYLTINTLLKDKEIEENLFEFLHPLYKEGLDAVIVQDFGVVNFIKRNYPDLPIHASTQMGITGIEGAKVLQEHGVTRVVTARELSLTELRKIKEHTSIEIESFIHGALCYCYSGQCLLSSMLGGRSGNRGKCAQPCRLPYKIKESKPLYLLSPKDLCTLEILPEIIEAGVSSLKIEGRMKSPDYCAGVTSIYRKYLDILAESDSKQYSVDQADLRKLVNLYSRSGHTTGYYKQHNSREMITIEKPGYLSQNNEERQAVKIIPISGCIEIYKDKPMKLTLFLNELVIEEYGPYPQVSINKPLNQETIQKQIKKTGGTEFSFEHLEICLDENLFVSLPELNQIRRIALEELSNALIKPYLRTNRNRIRAKISPKVIENSILKINCSVENIQQFNSLLTNEKISAIYINYNCIDLGKIEYYVQQAHQHHKELYLALPPIFREKARVYFDSHTESLINSKLDGFIIKNIDEYGYFCQFPLKKLIFDYSMYSMNNEAKSFFIDLGAAKLTIPLELNFQELKYRGCYGEELIVYGYLPLMVSAGCLKNTLNQCNHKEEIVAIEDRYKKHFMVKNSCRFCYNTLYNSQPLSLLGVAEKVKELSISSIRMNFTNEEPDVMQEILNSFIQVFKENQNQVREIENFTRGHFKRGVE